MEGREHGLPSSAGINTGGDDPGSHHTQLNSIPGGLVDTRAQDHESWLADLRREPRSVDAGTALRMLDSELQDTDALLVIERLAASELPGAIRHQVFETARYLAFSENPFVQIRACRTMLELGARDIEHEHAATLTLRAVIGAAGPALARSLLSLDRG